MKKIIPLILVFFSISCVTNPTKSPIPNQEVNSIAFGSCNHQNKAQPLWPSIASNHPGLWIWTGDIVYADTTDEKVLRQTYEKQLSNTSYRKFLKSTPVIGVWDDHDYSDNDSDRTAPNKRASQLALLDFLQEPRESPRRKRLGIYQDYRFQTPQGPIFVYLLDTRYHKDPWQQKAGSILGENQWQWLDERISTNGNGTHIFVTSIQAIPRDHRFEAWIRFPKERNRLWRLFKKHKLKAPILISGDRHIAEISHLSAKESGVNGGVWEVTSSGLTHTYRKFKGEKNRHRIGKPSNQLNFGLIRFEKNKTWLEVRGIGNQLLIQQNIENF